MPKNQRRTEYTRLYARLHHKYQTHPSADWSFCFYCKTPSPDCADHCPPLLSLEQNGQKTEEIQPSGHKASKWQAFDTEGRPFVPTIVPTCRQCIQRLTRIDSAFSPEERRKQMQRLLLEEQNPSLAAAIKKGHASSREESLKTSLSQIFRRK